MGEIMEDTPIYLKESGAIEIYDLLRDISGKKILDVATGDGDFIETLMQSLKNYQTFIGIDSDKEEIKKARKRFKEKPVKIRFMKGERLTFPDNSFDIVTIANSLHHLENIELVLSEMLRVLKKNGFFILQEMCCDGGQTKAQKIDILTHAFHAEIDSMLGIYHQKTFTREEINDIVSKIGLSEYQILESSRYVKCLFCEENKQCENPLNKEFIDYAIKEIDDNLERIKEHKDYKDIEQRASVLKQRILKNGNSPASILFICGKK